MEVDMIQIPKTCDLCKEGTLTKKQGVNTVSYKGNQKKLRTDFLVCDNCGTEMTSPKQTQDNKNRMTAFKKEIDSLVNSD